MLTTNPPENYYSISLAKVVSAQSHRNIYRVVPLFQSTSLPSVYEAISIGSRGQA